MGQHADRNAQFERIAELKEQYLNAGHPVISIDTKKKEMLGNFHRDGVTDAVEPTLVNDHDFASASDGKVIFKEDLQGLSNRLGLKIRVCHYPPYCSKYNPIEHRVFPHVTRACKGIPLETIETAKHYIEKTETTKGLKVVVRILDKVYNTGRRYAKDFKNTMTIKFDEYLPTWNYTAIPDAQSNREVVSGLLLCTQCG